MWHLLRDWYWRLGADEDRELVMLEIAGGERGSHLAPATARLSDVNHLRMAGWTYREIASKLGISVRHASRLGRTDPVPILRRDLHRLACARG